MTLGVKANAPQAHWLHERTRYERPDMQKRKDGYEPDTQKQRLYDSERAAFKGREFVTFTDEVEAQEYLDHLLARAWFGRRFAVPPSWTSAYPTIIRGYSGHGSWAAGSLRYYRGEYIGMHTIKLSPEHMTKSGEWVLLHELAHHIVPKPHSWHGRLFARTYMELVKWRMGTDAADALRSEFRERNVKFTPGRKQTPHRAAATP